MKQNLYSMCAYENLLQHLLTTAANDIHLIATFVITFMQKYLNLFLISN